MLMMKRILSLMLCMMCIVCIKAQDTPPPTTEESGSGWTDPSGNYQAETVIYAVVEDDNQSRGILSRREGSQIAAFVDGTVRAVVDVENYTSANREDGSSYSIYTFRVGGEDADKDKEITFQVYDAGQGIIYPLTCKTQDGESAAPVWTGDATTVYPSNYYELSYHSISWIELKTSISILTLKVDESKDLKDEISFEYYGADDVEPTMPITPLRWEWAPSEWNPGEVEIEDGVVTAKELCYGYIEFYVGEEYIGRIDVSVYNPMTSIAVEDITVIKGNVYPTPIDITFNNGESEPTYPDVRFEYDTEKLAMTRTNDGFCFMALEAAQIGEELEVKAYGDQQPDSLSGVASATFNVTIGSAITNYFIENETVEVWLMDEYEMEISEWLGRPIYELLEETDDFMFDFDTYDAYVDSYSIESDNPDVVEYNSDRMLMAKTKGVAHLTLTNEYDPTKKLVVTVNVNQAPISVAITSVNNVEIPEASPSMPVVEVAIGQTATAIAQVTPLNADFDDFTIEFVDANHGPIGNVIEDMSWIEYNSTVENGVCTLTFTANRLPVPADQDIYLKAIVTNENMDAIGSSLVKVVFVKKVAEIVVPESKTVWVNELPSKEIMVDIVPVIYPEDATNKDLEITFDKEGILEAMGDGNLLPHEKGTVNVTYTSVDNPSVSATCEVTIKVRVQRISYAVTGKFELYNDGNWTDLPELEIYPEYADFDPDYLYHDVPADEVYPVLPEEWSAVQVDGTRISGRAICNSAAVISTYGAADQEGLEDGGYNPTAQLTVIVKEKIDLTEGWNWISLISGVADVRYALNDEAGSSAITEARSQTALIYNDPVFGFFGDLTGLAPRREAYKIDAARDASMIIENVNMHSMIYDNKAFNQSLNPRWNWVGYPYEYQYLLSETYDATKLAEGDMVITKTGDMAIVKDGEWTGDFFVKPNTGMMLYHNGDADSLTLKMKARGDLYQGYWEGDAIPRAKEREISVWQYDGSRFPNMMAVVGQLNIDSADDYTIGAFVGDECRGAGKIVDGLVLVSLAGEAGEKVTFRLHNEWTGEFIEVDNVLNFSDLAGSLKNPVMLNVPEDATAIDNVSTEGISISGNVLYLGTYNGTATVTTIDGKVVAKTTESSISVDELPAGIYVVVIEGGAKPIVKKIIKD